MHRISVQHLKNEKKMGRTCDVGYSIFILTNTNTGLKVLAQQQYACIWYLLYYTVTEPNQIFTQSSNHWFTKLGSSYRDREPLEYRFSLHNYWELYNTKEVCFLFNRLTWYFIIILFPPYNPPSAMPFCTIVIFFLAHYDCTQLPF